MSNQMPAPVNNPYKPPNAALEIASDHGFYVVSMRKFWTMSIATAGLYFVYWYFRHYQTIRLKTGESLWPIARAIFMIFFFHDLYHRFAARALSRNRDFTFNHAQYATATVVVILVSFISSQLSSHAIAVPITNFLALLLIFAQAYLMAGAQSVANFANDDEQGRSNANFTALNVFWMAIGTLIWGLVVFGIYATVFRPELLRSAGTVG